MTSTLFFQYCIRQKEAINDAAEDSNSKPMQYCGIFNLPPPKIKLSESVFR